MSDFLKEYGIEGPLGFPMLDRHALLLESLLKAIPKGKEYAYRKHVSLRAPTELNPGERSDVSWISTESVDRCGDVVIARGMNDAQFQGNPIVTLGHAYHLPPVGRSLWRKRVKDGDMVGIKAKTRYPEKPESWPDPWMPDKVLSLVQAGLLNGKSIGFLPTKVGFADEKTAQKNSWPEGTCVIEEWLLLEYACCFLGANQDALVESVSKGLDILVTDHGPRTTDHDSPVPFVTLTSVEEAVTLSMKSLDLEKIVENSLKLAYDKARGRI